jgi:hypothetical protein
MTRREAGFLLVGLGTGLILAVAVVIEFLLSIHGMFVVGFRLRPESVALAIPFLLIALGLILMRHRKNGQQSI